MGSFYRALAVFPWRVSPRRPFRTSRGASRADTDTRRSGTSRNRRRGRGWAASTELWLFSLAVFLRAVLFVPVAVPVEQILIRADQERAGTAGGIEDAQLL